MPETLLLLLLLLSRFSCVRLCATPETAAHQAPPSMGFSRQEYWSGVPLLAVDIQGFRGGPAVKNQGANAGDVRDMGLIPRSGRSPGEGTSNPLQYSCLENPMEGGAWQATVHGVTKSRTRLSDFTFQMATFLLSLSSVHTQSWYLPVYSNFLSGHQSDWIATDPKGLILI